MKKVIALLLAATVILSMALCAFADGEFAGRTLHIGWDSCEMDEAWQAQIDAFCEKYGCEVEVEFVTANATGGSTYGIRAANGTLPDVFANSIGAQLEEIFPAETLINIADYDFINNIADAYIEASRTADGGLYAVPTRTSNVAGVFYNKVKFAELGLEIPTTWDEFLETCKWIRENTDMDPVCNPYDGAAGRQITYLAQYFYVHQDDPDFVSKYLAQEVDLHDSEAIMRGLQKVYDQWELGYQNEDPLSTSLEAAAMAICEGDAAFVICRTNIMTNVEIVAPECYNDIGFFPLPDNDPDARGVAVWMPTGWVAAKEGSDPELAVKFLEFTTTEEAVNAICTKVIPTGAFMVKGVSLPETVSTAVREAQEWVSKASQPVMEYVCPIKGTNLPVILSMVGTGELTPDEGIEQIEADFRLYAEQQEIW